ncbi:MAG: hypothetical protein K2P12_00420, partial [Clostridia bacterium]|nr:hypothetical protein [Clostridia bacterium]
TMYYSYIKGGLVCKNCRDSKVLELSANSLDLFKHFSGINIEPSENFSDKDYLAVIQIYCDELSKNFAKKFKTFEEFILFYNKINILQ